MIELINTNTSKERLDELIKNITNKLDYIAEYWEVHTKNMECGEYREYVDFCKELDDTRAFLILYRESITTDKAISDMQKLEKIEQIFEIRGFGEYPCTYEDMCREVMKILKGGAEND